MPSKPRVFRDPPPNFAGLNPHETVEIHRRNIPHWRQKGATYFVTYRLSDSLPKAKTDQLREYRDDWLRRNPVPHSDEQLEEFAKLFATKVEAWLDQGAGCCALSKTVHAKIVELGFVSFRWLSVIIFLAVSLCPIIFMQS